MSNRNITTSAAMLALIAGLGTTAMAQTTPGADLPAPLSALNLGNLQIDTKRDGMREIDGRTADGVDIEAKVDRDNNLIEVEADDAALPQSLVDALATDAVRANPAMALFTTIQEFRQHPEHVEIKGRLASGEEIEARFDRQNTLIGVETDDVAIPAELVNTLLPQAVRDSDILGQFARIEEIGIRDGRISVGGDDADGQDMRALLDADGRVLRFGRDDDDRPRDDRGPGKHHDHAGRPGDRPADHGPRDKGPRGAGPAGDGPRGPAPIPADFDAVSVNQKLTAAGFKDFGLLRADGPRLMLEATNPQGEAVTLELDPRGEVVRETAR